MAEERSKKSFEIERGCIESHGHKVQF